MICSLFVGKVRLIIVSHWTVVQYVFNEIIYIKYRVFDPQEALQK